MAIGNLLTMEEAAERIGVSLGRISQFHKDGRLPIAIKLGRRPLFDRRAVESFARRERPAGKPTKKR